MPRKITLNIDNKSNYLMIGISSHLKDYRISFFLNRVLGFNFRRIDDFTYSARGNETLSYPVFVYHDPDLRAHFCLMSNHHPEKKLIPALKQTDYFIFTNDPINDNNVQDLVRQIKSTPNVLTAYKIDPSEVKNMDVISADLELHLLHHK